MNKHQEHILCIKSDVFKSRSHGFVEYELNIADLMLGQRAKLEKDDEFRQVLPISIFTYQGKVWAYERTPKGGESRLHNKVAVAVGGHWDMDDLVVDNSIINLHKSIDIAMERELEEEIALQSRITNSRKLRKLICADDTEVDRHHIAVVYLHELDGEEISSTEDQLKTIGFVSPEELLSGSYNIEVWTRLICEILLNE
jgi:predicted NUDIX family phosphoesterase